MRTCASELRKLPPECGCAGLGTDEPPLPENQGFVAAKTSLVVASLSDPSSSTPLPADGPCVRNRSQLSASKLSITGGGNERPDPKPSDVELSL